MVALLSIDTPFIQYAHPPSKPTPSRAAATDGCCVLASRPSGVCHDHSSTVVYGPSALGRASSKYSSSLSARHTPSPPWAFRASASRWMEALSSSSSLLVVGGPAPRERATRYAPGASAYTQPLACRLPTTRHASNDPAVCRSLEAAWYSSLYQKASALFLSPNPQSNLESTMDVPGGVPERTVMPLPIPPAERVIPEWAR
mmetsp:Transcript_34928/g.88206  ORF Transcript_34928/g.88206 Transcript_34928/m.88206 type:complete len:201 (-) Transcript_34928:333-935(-)